MPPSPELLVWPEIPRYTATADHVGNLECRQTPVFPGLYGVVNLLGSDDAAIAGVAN
ncbi:hypothetical protein MY10362_000391 [Beauveria mimosiformis]